MRGHGNVTGADAVVTWQTGYPFGVSLTRGYPRFNPGEFTTVDLLARREADAALTVSADPMSNFPQPAREHLAAIPSICLDPKLSETAKVATVAFTTAVYGINVPGTAYRMDAVPIPLRAAFQSPFRSDEDVLRGVEHFARMGVVANIRVLRLNEYNHESMVEALGHGMEKVSPERMIRLALEQKKILERHGLSTGSFETMCHKCGCCDIVPFKDV